MSISEFLPHSAEAESIVIGMMLMLSDYNDFACQTLHPEDFYIQSHSTIFKNLQKMYTKDQSPELRILTHNLSEANELHSVGGDEYIQNCINGSSSSYDFEAYVEIVKEKSMAREFFLYFHQVVSGLKKNEKSIKELLQESQEKIFEIEKKQNKVSCLKIGDIMNGKHSKDGLSFLEVLKKRREISQSKEYKGFLGISTGIHSLDLLINGLGDGNLIVMAARPSVGKTAFLCHMCVDIAIRNNITAGIFTLEMAPEQITERLMANYYNIEQCKLLKDGLPQEEIDLLSKDLSAIENAPIYYYDAMNVSISSLVTGAKRMKDLYDIKVLFIDYLQLLEGSPKYKNSDSKVNEVSEISRKLKLLSRELKIPIICLSQLNRNIEARAVKEPMLSDLRDSGSIEQDADIVILLNRPDMYDQTKPPGILWADVAKNRHGATGKVKLFMEMEYGRVLDFPKSLEESKQKDRVQYDADF